MVDIQNKFLSLNYFRSTSRFLFVNLQVKTGESGAVIFWSQWVLREQAVEDTV
jgi:hypothetical protein